MLLALLSACPAGAQSPRPYAALDSLGLDPVLLHETGYFTNTQDGYTVVVGLDRRWHYAKLNALGNVVPTDMPLGVVEKRGSSERTFRAEAARHLEREPVVSVRLERRQSDRKAAVQAAAEERSLYGSATGLQRILVLAIEFPDYRSPLGIAYVDSMMNTGVLDRSGIGSFREYFLENSYGHFEPASYVYGWFEASHSVLFYRDTLDRESASNLLVEEALSQADSAGVDFSFFDNNGDGSVSTVVLFTPLRISAHYSFFRGKRQIQPTGFNAYAIQELDLGALVHEYGHALGLRDLYKRPRPFGYYDPMADGWRWSPRHFSAYSKILLGWIDPVVIDEETSGLEVPNSHDYPFAVVIRGRNGTDWSYFIIENRAAKGYDSRFGAASATSGLIIYHIHENSTDWSHVEQADGRWDLEAHGSSEGRDGNRGDAGDFFPGTTGNTRFGPDTNPSSRTEGGVDTGILLTNISAPGDIMTFDVQFPVPVTTAFENVPDRPGNLVLHPIYPNPFSEKTTIRYDLPQAAEVTLKIFDSVGREVARLESGMRSAGSHHVPFRAGSLPAGPYFCRITAGDFGATRKLMLVR